MTQPDTQDVALIVGGGPGISSSCARLFADNGMRVAVAARSPDKPVLQALETSHGVRRYACDAGDPAAVDLLFQNVVRDLGAPTLVVHNIDGGFPHLRQGHHRSPAGHGARSPCATRRSARSWWVSGRSTDARQQAECPRRQRTIIFTNASAALKGFPKTAPLPWPAMPRPGWLKAWRGIDAGASMSPMCRSTAISGRRRRQPRRRRNDRRRRMADPTASPRPACSCIASIAHLAFEIALRPWTERW